MSQVSIVSTCSFSQLAIFRTIFPKVKIDLFKELYKDLPEDTLALKVIKLRKIFNLEREEFSNLIGHHWTTVKQWETEDVPPKPESIMSICTAFEVPLKYFHEYYNIYFSNYRDKIKEWRELNKYTYQGSADLLNISYSGFARLLNGKISLSYSMYLKLKDLKII